MTTRPAHRRYYLRNRAYILARNARNRRLHKPDPWFARYFKKMHAFIARAQHKRYLAKRWARLESGELVFQDNGIAEPKPLPGGLLRPRTFR